MKFAIAIPQFFAERARNRTNAALEGIYGHRVPAIEAAAIAGTTASRVGS